MTRISRPGVQQLREHLGQRRRSRQERSGRQDGRIGWSTRARSVHQVNSAHRRLATLVPMGYRWVIGTAALAATLLRAPGLVWPPRPDEAGFLLVARHWSSGPHGLYGDYWVDRSPVLLGTFRIADQLDGSLGGPLDGIVGLRVLSAVGCGLLVLAMAGCARLVADRRTAAWTAVGTAAVLSNALIDPVSAKGEVLGIPLVGASFWLVLLALRRPDRVGAVLAALAGAAAVLAVGMKQNLVAGLVFGAVAVLGSAVAGRVPPRRAGGLLLATAAGAAVPVLVVVGWSLAEDNRLHELWYGLVGFRSDAARVLAEDPGHAGDRVVLLLGVLVATGVAVLLLAFVLHLRSAWRLDPVLTAAAGAVLLVDLTTLALSGSFWLPYLFALVPGTALAILLVVGAGGRPGRRVRMVVAGAATSSALAIVGWSLVVGTGGSVPAEHRTGEAIARAAAPGDTIVVHGGRADIVLASGLRSPYPYLWSLPMRVHDPELEQLRVLLASDEAPTWVVERVGLGAWSMDAAAVEATLARRYVRHGTGCLGHPVHLRRDVDRPALAVDCESPVDLVGGQDAARRMTQASSRE